MVIAQTAAARCRRAEPPWPIPKSVAQKSQPTRRTLRADGSQSVPGSRYQHVRVGQDSAHASSASRRRQRVGSGKSVAGESTVVTTATNTRNAELSDRCNSITPCRPITAVTGIPRGYWVTPTQDAASSDGSAFHCHSDRPVRHSLPWSQPSRPLTCPTPTSRYRFACRRREAPDAWAAARPKTPCAPAARYRRRPGPRHSSVPLKSEPTRRALARRRQVVDTGQVGTGRDTAHASSASRRRQQDGTGKSIAARSVPGTTATKALNAEPPDR
ncbi:MAG: hypothetical protein ACJAZN_002159 [Planctomycetota bacterium]